MGIDKKILSEIERYNSIVSYIKEQTVEPPPPDPAADAAAALGATPGLPPATPEVEGADVPKGIPTPQPLDVESDPDVEKLDDKGKSTEKKDDEGGTEELEITDLVDAQKNIQQKQDEYFENLFGQLSNLEKRLGEMDQIMGKLNSLESKLEKYRSKSPEEKLNLRVYDSYPYNQRLSDFFDDKKEEMEKTGKNEYVLTDDQVSDINVNDIKNSFQPSGEDREDFRFK
jgi:hypothetical protein